MMGRVSGRELARLFILGSTLVLVPACERASERAAEKMIEDAMKAEGVDADVDMSSGRVSITAQDGSSTVQIAGDQSIDLPEGFPDDVPIYPAAKVSYSVSQAGEGLSVTLSAEAQPGPVYDYYLEHLKQNGWTIDQEMKSSGLFILHGTKGDREAVVSITGEGRNSMIQLVITGG